MYCFLYRIYEVRCDMICDFVTRSDCVLKCVLLAVVVTTSVSNVVPIWCTLNHALVVV